jgi:hypothetical protein
VAHGDALAHLGDVVASLAEFVAICDGTSNTCGGSLKR